MKSIFEEFAGELIPEEYKALIARLKKQKYSYLVFSLRHPFGVELFNGRGEQLKISNQKIAMDDDAQVLAGVMNLLEAERNACDRGVVESVTQGPDIPAMREQLAVLVLTGKSKEAIGVTLTHEEVKRLTDKDVEKYSKRYQTFIGSKTTESLIGSMIDLYAYAASAVLNIKDVDRLKEDLKNDFTINKELTVVAGSLALKFGNFLALANTALITTRHVAFATEQSPAVPQQSSGLLQQSSAVPEHSEAI